MSANHQPTSVLIDNEQNSLSLLEMQPAHESRVRDHRMLVPSPRCLLSCEALSTHLPALSGNQHHSRLSKYISPPMSASPKPSRNFTASPRHPSFSRPHHDSPTPPRTSSGKSTPAQPRASLVDRSRPRVPERDASTATSNADNESGGLLHLRRDPERLRESSIDQLSSTTQGSPEARQLLAGPPGIARRAKAHVPSACINCKRKHLACETRRPCNRCVQTGKEVRLPENLIDILGKC